jgi:Ni2+-binding GTPase involved in maturation of urease and hydrogenase
MKLITLAGPPSSGKTSVLLRIIEALAEAGIRVGVVKFDCMATFDDRLYEEKGIPVLVGLSGNVCPDHYFVTNIASCLEWGSSVGADMLITESAGLCNRCSPYIRQVQSVCVIDHLSGLNTPAKIGPMLKLADTVLLTKGDIVSQAEREVFRYRVRKANPKAEIIPVNGLTGQGKERARDVFLTAPEVGTLDGSKLRFSMPAAVCSYCLGETRIGEDAQMGNVRKLWMPGEEG